MILDELGLVPVEKANSKKTTASRKGPTGPRNESFMLRRSSTVNGERFTFTPKAWEQTAIGPNSAKQFNTATGVLIAIMPGNSGVFLRNTTKGNKGRAFKNDELAKALDEREGYAGAKRFNLKELGEKDGAKYYILEAVAYTPRVKAVKAAEQPEAAPAQ